MTKEFNNILTINNKIANEMIRLQKNLKRLKQFCYKLNQDNHDEVYHTIASDKHCQECIGSKNPDFCICGRK